MAITECENGVSWVRSRYFLFLIVSSQYLFSAHLLVVSKNVDHLSVVSKNVDYLLIVHKNVDHLLVVSKILTICHLSVTKMLTFVSSQ